MKLNKLDRDEAFRYMGYKGGGIPQNILRLADECEERLLAEIQPKYVYRIFDIYTDSGGLCVSGTELVFKGKSIAEHLKDCGRCILMCATLSAGADKVIRSYEAAEMEKAVIADCMASAAVEQICDTAEREIEAAFGNYNYTWRFSPGYGDFPLDIQKKFLDVLEAQKRIGVTVTESLLLIPRKSVTAVIGISENEIPKGKSGCGSCNMRENCSYRKRGVHCGS